MTSPIVCRTPHNELVELMLRYALRFLMSPMAARLQLENNSFIFVSASNSSIMAVAKVVIHSLFPKLILRNVRSNHVFRQLLLNKNEQLHNNNRNDNYKSDLSIEFSFFVFRIIHIKGTTILPFFLWSAHYNSTT